MAMTVNSGKKIKYFEGILETFVVFERKLTECGLQIHGNTKTIRMASVDRAYNCVVEMRSMLVASMRAAGKTSHEVLEELAKSTSRGQALVKEAKRVLPLAETVSAFSDTGLPKISDSTIESRGLDENYTPQTKSALNDNIQEFIKLRSKLIHDVSEITSKNKEEDFQDVYRTIGVNLEEICNNTVSLYNEMVAQLTKIDSDFAKQAEQAAESAKRSKTETRSVKSLNLSGDGMDV